MVAAAVPEPYQEAIASPAGSGAAEQSVPSFSFSSLDLDNPQVGQFVFWS